MSDPFEPFVLYLEYLDSHDGRLFRRRRGGDETDWDLVATIPTPPGQRIFTMRDLRALVQAGEEWKAFKERGCVQS